MPEVTVVIPTHNRSTLLSQAVRSALRQRGVDLEVVVVDDGSSDDTAEVIARLADPRVRLARNERPEGVSAARNRGIAMATAEWVAFLDDDDLWSPAKLASQLHAATHLSRSWACGGSVTVDDALAIVAGGPPPSAEAIARQLPLRNMVPAGASNVVVRKSALMEVGGFDLQLRHLADWDLWIRLGTLGPPAVVCEPVVAYRLHVGNASTDAGVIAAELARVEERSRALRNGEPLDWAFTYRWAAWHYLWTARRGQAVRAYGRAILAGDITSIGRVLVALVDPGVARRRLKRYRQDPSWKARAAVWLRELAVA